MARAVGWVVSGSVDHRMFWAYSRVPSARHVDELYRICWTLEEDAAQRE
jgi:hypothetical protein